MFGVSRTHITQFFVNTQLQVVATHAVGLRFNNIKQAHNESCDESHDVGGDVR
jgi:hypothetical protein